MGDIRRELFAAMLTLGAAGCLAQQSSVVPTHGEVQSVVLVDRLLYQPVPEEAQLVRLATIVPGFGGYYYDQRTHTLRVYLRNLSSANLLRDELMPLAARVGGRSDNSQGGPAEIVYEQGQFDFIDLAQWRDHLVAQLPATDGVIFIDLQEAANRILIGAENAGVVSRVQSMLREMAVPTEAVIFETVGPMQLTNLALSYQSLSPSY